MTDEAHIYKMAYAQVERALADLIDACYDKDGRPRMPKADHINKAQACLPETMRKPSLVHDGEGPGPIV